MNYRTMAGNTSDASGPLASNHHENEEDIVGDDAPEYNVTFTTAKAPVTSTQSFTPRSLIVGLIIGTLIIFSNTYFGLQTGWISIMTMPSSLIGFAVFKSLSKHLSFPFTPVENVLIQTVAGAVGTMPLGCGFVGVIPALEFLLRSGEDGPSGDGGTGDGGTGEGGPLNIGFWKLAIWSLGVCLFGAIFAVPLRKEVIIREKLRFPSGTATALMIRVLHGSSADEKATATNKRHVGREHEVESEALLAEEPSDRPVPTATRASVVPKGDGRNDWKSKIRLLIGAFAVSAFYTLFSYFIPQIRDVPILGLTLAQNWLWTLNPSPAYVGQGIIMGPSTSMHMLFGAVLGWGILSPLARYKDWAPGPVNDWENGSKGWIVWVSLAIMLADSLINLGWLIVRTAYEFLPGLSSTIQSLLRNRWSRRKPGSDQHSQVEYSALNLSGGDPTHGNDDEDDAPPSELVSTRTVLILLPMALVLNVICMHIAFGDIISPFLSTIATLLALLLSIMGVRALGETDLNPVSGISKLTQLIFSLVTPASMHTRRSAIVTNLLAGAVSEAGALQAGDLMQDLKTGHLLGASPKAQFYGQLIGSIFGAVVSTAVYKMYVNVYDVPGDQFQVPTAYVWIFTARLVTGQGLPPMAWQAALIFGAIFVATTILRIVSSYTKPPATASSWVSFIPGGIAVAVGMFNVPSFTLARAMGGAIAWWWSRRQRKQTVTTTTQGQTDPVGPTTAATTAAAVLPTGNDTTDEDEHVARAAAATADNDESSSRLVVLASGLILGEGVLSIVNLILASFRVPHL